MYQRLETQDGVTVMNKALYDNLQDGIDTLNSEMEISFKNTTILAITLSMYTQSSIPGLEGNMVILTFEDDSGFTLSQGKYDSVNKVIYA